MRSGEDGADAGVVDGGQARAGGKTEAAHKEVFAHIAAVDAAGTEDGLEMEWLPNGA